MFDQDLNPHNPTRQPARPHRWSIASLACLSLTLGPGCGLRDASSHSGVSVEVIKGKDSAGAIIELEKRGDDLTRARVIDVVLGTGEAEIISDEDGYIEFTIDFPGGAAITYRGQQADAGALEDVTLSGTWRQHPGGVFGEDFGTWEAQTGLDHKP